MTQLLSPDDYAKLNLPDMWIENLMQARQADMLLERLDGCRRILDLGWGEGIIARALHAAGKEITVLEGSLAGIEEARHANIPSVHSLFESYDTSEPYDAVIASFVLEHVVDPVLLLKRCRRWGRNLICIVGNSHSYHRQLAVQMGLQPKLNTLSERDRKVGHYIVFSYDLLDDVLTSSGWTIKERIGLMFKPLPNSMLINLPENVVKAMCEIPVSWENAANIMVTCE